MSSHLVGQLITWSLWVQTRHETHKNEGGRLNRCVIASSDCFKMILKQFDLFDDLVGVYFKILEGHLSSSEPVTKTCKACLLNCLDVISCPNSLWLRNEYTFVFVLFHPKGFQNIQHVSLESLAYNIRILSNITLPKNYHRIIDPQCFLACKRTFLFWCPCLVFSLKGGLCTFGCCWYRCL